MFYLNQFYYSNFDNLGIPIGYSDNMNIIYRYIFSLIKYKINKNEKVFINEKETIKFVFNTFKIIFQTIKIEKIDFLKYFSFLFRNVIFDVDKNILFKYKYKKIPSYFKKICNQFIDKDDIDKNSLSLFKSGKNNDISYGKKGETKIKINN